VLFRSPSPAKEARMTHVDDQTPHPGDRPVSRRTALAGGMSVAAAAALRTRFNASAQQTTPGATPVVPMSAATAPMQGFDIYVAGLHCAKNDPTMQMEAHHYCKKNAAGVYQCAIFDGNTADAILIGLEYIVDEATFQSLPADERVYWHPHNYEVFSGLLVAPTLSSDAELELMQTLLNSYGKTWHVWWTGRRDGQGKPADPVPMGDAMLQWSFNRDGQADPSLEQSFVQELGIDKEANRQTRAKLVQQAHPQEGVNALSDFFPNQSDMLLPGVEDAGPSGEATPTS